MRTTTAGRRGAALVTAVVVAVTGAGVAATAPAHAGGSPVRAEQASAHDLSPSKTAVASCPGATSVFAAGARIVGADGGVVLTGMIPDPALTSVTVAASARTGYAEAWSLVAYAVCDLSTSPPGRVATTTSGWSTATATCPGETRLTGTGFRVQGPVDHSYVDRVTVGAALRQVQVHAGGPGTPTSLTAYAICKPPTQPSGPPGVRVETTSGSEATWPKTVTAGDPSFAHRIYGVGAVVEGGAGQVFLSALVPDLDQNLVLAEAVRALPLPAAGFLAVGGQDGSDAEGSVTVYGILIGTFH